MCVRASRAIIEEEFPRFVVWNAILGLWMTYYKQIEV